MEFVVQPRPSGACNLLGVPGLGFPDVDDEEGEAVFGIRPKSSPLPRRRSSDDEDSEPEPQSCGSRRVSFADTKGLSLVQIKEFDTWEIPKLPGYESTEGEGKDAEEYFLSPLFSLPISSEELFMKVKGQKVELESIELLPRTTILKGLIRVLNVSFTKAVYVRTTLDCWSSHFDLLTEYVPGSSDGVTDSFSFKLTLMPPLGEQGGRVDFCLRYETPDGTFWANNNNKNYVLVYHKREKGTKEKLQAENVNKKSCLKTVRPPTISIFHSQSFPAMKNISSLQTSPSQESVSTGVSNRGEEVRCLEAQQLSECQSGASEEDGQQLVIENRRSRGRRNRRKSARMAHVKDCFTQGRGTENDGESDASLPVSAHAAQEETPEEKHSDTQSEASQCVSEALTTCNKASVDVQRDPSPARGCTSDTEPEKPESINEAESAALTAGEPVTDIPDMTKHGNVNKSPKAEEGRQERDMSCECTSNPAGEPGDNAFSAENTEGPVCQTNSFMFGTLLAPLYYEVFGRVGSENQSSGDLGNSICPRGNVADLSPTQSCRHTQSREAVSADSADASSNLDKIQASMVTTKKSDVTVSHLLAEKGETICNEEEHLRNPAEIKISDLKCSNAPNVPDLLPAELKAQPNTVNPDLLRTNVPRETLDLQGKAKKDDLTLDLHKQTLGEKTQGREGAHSILSQNVTVHVSAEMDHQTSAGGANGCECVDVSNKDDAAAKETENTCVCCLEESFSNVTTPADTSLKEMNDMQERIKLMDKTCRDDTKHSAENQATESMTNVTTSNDHTHIDMFVGLTVEDTAKDKAVIVSEKDKCLEMQDTVSKQEDSMEDRNWEMMVEEEEYNIFTPEEAITVKSEDMEVVEKDKGDLMEQQLEGAVIEMALESMEEEKAIMGGEMMEEINAAEEKEEMAQDAVGTGNTEKTGEEEMWEIVDRKEREDEGKRLEEDVGMMDKKITSEEEIMEKIEIEEEEEVQEISIQETKICEEENIRRDEDMEIGLNEEDEMAVELVDHMKPEEENMEEESPAEEEMVVDEAGEAEIADEDEVSGSEERLDVKQKLEDDLSALVDNVQKGGDESITDEGNTGEGQNVQMHLRTEEEDQSYEDVTRDRSEAKNNSTTAEGGSCTLTDDPESDHDSASAESLSDDEVELYMHCLRAVQGQHGFPQAARDRNKDAGCSVAKRPSAGRGKVLATAMPSITESLDEEQQHPSGLLGNHEDAAKVDFQPAAAASGKENINTNVSRWKETFSCGNISKTILYASVLVLFLVVAYHYDFLACFGLYLISLVWLCCQGEEQPVKNNNRIG